jgi:hypothetical protein
LGGGVCYSARMNALRNTLRNARNAIGAIGKLGSYLSQFLWLLSTRKSPSSLSVHDLGNVALGGGVCYAAPHEFPP